MNKNMTSMIANYTNAMRAGYVAPILKQGKGTAYMRIERNRQRSKLALFLRQMKKKLFR